jgi:hypothetical protein
MRLEEVGGGGELRGLAKRGAAPSAGKRGVVGRPRRDTWRPVSVAC